MERTAEVKDQPRDAESERREWQLPVVVDLCGQPRGTGGSGACSPGSANLGSCLAGAGGPGV